MIVPHDLASKVVMPAIRCKMAELMINKFGLSQSQAADSLGVTQASISNYIRGVRIPSITLSSDLEEELELLKVKKDEAVKNADYEAAASLRDEAEKHGWEQNELQKSIKSENMIFLRRNVVRTPIKPLCTEQDRNRSPISNVLLQSSQFSQKPGNQLAYTSTISKGSALFRGHQTCLGSFRLVSNEQWNTQKVWNKLI